MIPLLSLVLLTSLNTAATAPVSDQYVAWRAEGNDRGTWSILSSCIFTLILCVYTAVHMNVPVACDTPGQRKWKLARWVLTGIFAPELVVWVAWCQWSEARRLTKALDQMRNKLGGKEEAVPLTTTYRGKYQDTRELLNSWTFQHSFFVVMGGYQLHPATVAKNPNILHPDQPRSVLNANAFLSLLESGHTDKLPLLSAQDIKDRSKADNLAKLLSCVQGLWLVFQLIGRVAARLTITELEVNTLAHVICATTMYAFWMYKPLNVEQPVFIDPTGLKTWILFHTGLDQSTITRFMNNRRVSSDLDLRSECPVTHVHNVLIPVYECRQCVRNRQLLKDQVVVGLVLSDQQVMSPKAVVQSLQKTNKLGSPYFIDFVMHDDRDAKNGRYDDREEYPDGTIRTAIHIAERELDVLLRLWDLPDRDEQLDQMKTGFQLDYASGMIGDEAFENEWRAFSMIGISSCYGGLHATLWNHHFPTTAEQWLWRISSTIVAGNGFLVVVACVVIVITGNSPRFVRFIDYVVEHSFDSDLSWIKYLSWTSLVLTILGICVVQFVFIFCRMFLFIEAFISLRSQPPEVYITPQWSQWLPHL